MNYTIKPIVSNELKQQGFCYAITFPDGSYTIDVGRNYERRKNPFVWFEDQFGKTRPIDFLKTTDVWTWDFFKGNLVIYVKDISIASQFALMNQLS